MGWPGPRRWRRGSWSLREDEQLAPVLAIRAAIDAAVQAAIDSHNAPPHQGTVEADIADPEAIHPRLREAFNSVLVNRYADGKATIKWHADDDRWYCHGADIVKQERSDIVIASVSFGAERWFDFRRKPHANPAERRRFRIQLRSGSLLIMAGATQRV